MSCSETVAVYQSDNFDTMSKGWVKKTKVGFLSVVAHDNVKGTRWKITILFNFEFDGKNTTNFTRALYDKMADVTSLM